ncbi:TIGR02300 family protein [Maritimibacter fusiformis]|uniref:TIGR02300 family protein n=1 Tax=Maritimibacter fusiformis TaxID=2603819 RepID=A0A5D0RMS1_9RHOB|nr:TIGR02300 family protein [Maritimibacter fusiformis]TYB82135.1 TIGR02300 family protein [Maritimibacter fusiformis]
MPKEEWGTKRVCPETGKRFYDLNANPVVSPYTGKVVEIDTGKTSRTMVADKADKATKAKEKEKDDLVDDEVIIEDDDDVDLEDDVLDDDEDDDVSLDDIADVAAPDDD